MMKFSGLVFIFLMLVGVGIYYYSNTENRSSEMTVVQELPAESTASPAAIKTAPVGPVELANNATQADTPKATEQQRAFAGEQEDKILQLTLEYEAARANPEQREAVREAMQQHLALYSEAVLPLAMEKMSAAQ